MRGLITGALLAVACVALACSGPNAQAHMAASTQYGRLSLIGASAIVFLVSALSLRTKDLLSLCVAAAILVSHPHWWISAYEGDCGGTLVVSATIYSVISAAILTYNTRLLYLMIKRAKSSP